MHRQIPRFRGRSTATERCAGAPASLLGFLTLALCATSACTDARAGQGPGEDASLLLSGSSPSLERLGQDVLDALVRGDTAALERVRLTEWEHNDVVWPELPASAPDVNFPIDYAWQNIQNRNLRALSRIVPMFQGRDLTMRGVECRGTTEAFATFRVHTDCWVTFTVGGAPEVLEAQVFKDVLVRGGGHKIFRYYDEEPRRYLGGQSG